MGCHHQEFHLLSTFEKHQNNFKSDTILAWYDTLWIRLPSLMSVLSLATRFMFVSDALLGLTVISAISNEIYLKNRFCLRYGAGCAL